MIVSEGEERILNPGRGSPECHNTCFVPRTKPECHILKAACTGGLKGNE